MQTWSFALVGPPRLAVVIGVVLACLCAHRTTASAAELTPAAKVAEVRRSFTIGGKPIPPEVFRDFGDGDLADSGSILVAIDADAAIGSNLYADPITPNGAWIEQKKPVNKDGEGFELTGYRYIGSTRGGLLVAVANYNGGGSGTFYTLHVLDVAAQAAISDDGKPAPRVVLTVLRNIPLGDRWDGEVKIVGDSMVVTTSRTGPADDSRKQHSRTYPVKRP